VTTPSFVDSANQLLTQVPVRLETGTIDAPAGTFAVITLRSASTTFTALLSAEDLGNWLDVLTGLRDSMAGGGSKVVPATVFDVAALSQRNGRNQG